MLTLQAFRSWNWLWDWMLNATWSLHFIGKGLSNTLDDFNRANFPKCQLMRLNCLMHSTPNSQQRQQLYSFDMRQKSQSNLQKWLLSASLLFCLLWIKRFPHSLDFARQNPVWQQSSFSGSMAIVTFHIGSCCYCCCNGHIVTSSCWNNTYQPQIDPGGHVGNQVCCS